MNVTVTKDIIKTINKIIFVFIKDFDFLYFDFEKFFQYTSDGSPACYTLIFLFLNVNLLFIL